MTLPEDDFVDPFFGGEDDGEPEEPRRTITQGAASWVRARGQGEPPDLFSVSITHRRDHPFKKKPLKNGKKQNGCETCGGAKHLVIHEGFPPSLNTFGSGAHRMVFQTKKKAWQERFVQMLEEAELPRGLGGIFVEATLGFPDRRKRDQGNYRFLLEKALGDALTEGGWLEDDDWSRYEFGRLKQEYEKGESWVRITVLPRWETEAVEEDSAVAQGTLL